MVLFFLLTQHCQLNEKKKKKNGIVRESILEMLFSCQLKSSINSQKHFIRLRAVH